MPKRILQGEVTSNKSAKTVTVKVERRVTHPVYKKVIIKSKKYHAHDELNKCQIGDFVSIEECSPISKTKSWQVVYDEAPKAAAKTTKKA
jgi:small subunit ribosomal protein S17